jgi:aryl-alcohol dehydrogenase-like predicted oxidoreductase
MNKICIGTANFGGGYGIKGNGLRISNLEFESIFSVANTSGIGFIDTAISYQGSESIVGNCKNRNFEIITKLPPLPSNVAIDSWVRNEIHGSLSRLNRDHLYGLLLHHPSDLIGKQGEALFRIIQDLKNQGIVRKLGISIYETSELDLFFSKFDFDIVQAPFNLFDRNIHESGWLSRLEKSGVEFHARSLFLQGMLFLKLDELPLYLSNFRTEFSKLGNWLIESRQSLVEASIRHALSYKGISLIVVGVSSAGQLAEIAEAASKPPERAPQHLLSRDVRLINPKNWK